MKIGKQTVLSCETLLIRDGETAEFDIPVPNQEPLKLEVSTAPPKDYRETEKPIIHHEYTGNLVRLKFSNFFEALGAITNNPTQVAESQDGQPILYIAVVYRMGGYTKIELQITMGRGT